MKLSPRTIALAFAALLLVVVAGCAKKPPATTPVPPAPKSVPTETSTPTPTPTPSASTPEPSTPGVSARDLQVVYFGYDSSCIKFPHKSCSNICTVYTVVIGREARCQRNRIFF